MSKTIALSVFLLLLISPFLKSQNQRRIPLDMYIIIDATEGFREVRDEIAAWVNDDIIDRLLLEGDKLMIWSAGETARLIHTETISSQKDVAKRVIGNIEIQGSRADFATAVQEASILERETIFSVQGAVSRISYILVVSSSAGNLAHALGGSSASLFRWSRAERSSRWQAMVVAPNIGDRVREAAAAFMRSP